MPALRPVFGERHDLRAVLSHQYRMLKLSRHFAIKRADGPTIFRIRNTTRCSGIDHWFDGKAHAWVQAFLTRLTSWNVWDVGPLVEFHTDAMANVLVHDAEAIIFSDIVNDCFANHRNRTFRVDRIDGQVQTIERTLSHAARFFVNLISIANQKCLRLIAVPLIDDRRQINIHDVTGPQFISSRNSVTNYIVDADATAVGKRTAFAGSLGMPACDRDRECTDERFYQSPTFSHQRPREAARNPSVER